MKHLIPLLLIVFVSCGNAEEKKSNSPYKEVDKEICFEAFKKGKVVDKQIEVYPPSQENFGRYILIDMIYKNKYYTLSIMKYTTMNSDNFLPTAFQCHLFEENKKNTR